MIHDIDLRSSLLQASPQYLQSILFVSDMSSLNIVPNLKHSSEDEMQSIAMMPQDAGAHGPQCPELILSK